MFEEVFAREVEEARSRHCGSGSGFGRGRHCGDKHFRGRHSEAGADFGGRHFGGRFRGRVFDNGDLRFVILKLIADKPRYGYDIIKAIEERLGGSYAPSPGVVYPTLTLLEELGYVTVTTGEGTKKLHTITPEGTAALETNKAAVDGLFERMDQAGAAFGRGRAPQIMRAVENFRMALRLKTSQGSLSEEQVRKIVEAIDAAARQVEQS
ncbi:Transcriptional regulator, PadR family [Acidisarcina polymorpha]|uniref:Transcriptional regulator, PadR family n=1 Tax=Acidisarcina polymorpha TaxID=2211140 RepID=A0A2Z5FSP9_9BACT|nr:PadR family transcriptional regulator [Acidisarcina polymorpha]AXC09840.1 Transcriptional regulator, PadR family [Acidisarcina polymorpha]